MACLFANRSLDNPAVWLTSSTTHDLQYPFYHFGFTAVHDGCGWYAGYFFTILSGELVVIICSLE